MTLTHRLFVLTFSAANGCAMALGAFVFGAAVLGAPGQASAETLSISATGLVRRCPCGGTPNDIAEENNGVFEGGTPDGRYFVPVVFPVTSGQRVCSFTMVYEDINAADTLTARLYRKAYKVNGNPFTAPGVMATVNSAPGTPATVRVATTSTIAAPVITPNVFYYIEADVKTLNLNILGFKIVYKPAC
jgi:hypothetical protein